MKILVGSSAAKIHFPDFPRIPKDIDYVSKTKIEKADCHYTKAFDYLFDQNIEIASPDQLYTIKVAHSFWDIHWEKTMGDILFFQSKNCNINYEFFNLLYRDFEEIHGKKKINLNKPNEEFFNDYVGRKYPHDKIHYSLSYPDIPMYEKLRFDKSKAWIDRVLFEGLSYQDKIKACNEEIFSLMIERFLIPNNFEYSYSRAYMETVKLVITQLTKGWFPLFIVENFNEFKVLKNDLMIEKFKSNIDNV